MDSLTAARMECNRKFKINFNGGEISSDGGLLLLKEFICKLGMDQVIQQMFKTNDTADYRIHKDSENLLQVILQTLCGYFRDDCADELRNDPLFLTMLDKDSAASQPTISRFFNRMDEDTLEIFSKILRVLRNIVYTIKKPEKILLDLDSTLLETYGHQEGEGFNYHYQANGYHPLLCYDGFTGDLLKAELRNGTKYCSNGAAEFMDSLLAELKTDLPKTVLTFRGDSGFAAPDLYEVLEKYGCQYAIRLKENSKLHELAKDIDDALYKATENNQIDYAVEYGEFMYQAGSWSHPRRVACKIEKPQGQFIHMYTFIVTTLSDLNTTQVIQYYRERGKMENFIKEGKNGFGFSTTSSVSKIVNANRLQVHVLSYNIFNWFRRLVLPDSMRKQRIGTVRLKLIKIAVRIVRSGRYITFKLCSSCPYMQQYFKTLENIQKLELQKS